MGYYKDSAMQRYFETLPAFVQESIKQSSISIDSLQQLEQVADQLTKKK